MSPPRPTPLAVALSALTAAAVSLGLGLAGVAHGATLPSTTTTSADYVIVGGGIAGLVLANRLSEDPLVEVLLIEAGVDPTGNPNVSTPAFETRLASTRFDWNLTTVAQAHVANRTLPYQQGLGLGGGSTVNYMAYARGAPSVYDHWAEVAGDEGWKWENLVAAFNNATHFTPPEQSSVPIPYNSSLYEDAHGAVEFGYPPTQENFGSYFLAAFQNSSSNGGPGLAPIDYNAGQSIGSGYHSMTIDARDSTRSSAASAYLPVLRGRNNVRIWTQTRAEGIQMDGTTATGVHTLDLATNYSTTVTARKEVILAAGAINTPKLLLLSGLGPAAHLREKNISVVLDLSAVGSHAEDHVFASLTYEVRRNISTTAQWANETYFEELLSDYLVDGEGQLSSDLGGAQATERVPDELLEEWNASYHRSLPADQNHLQYLFDATLFTDPSSEANIITVVAVLTTPESRGVVRLNTTHPGDAALWDPAYLSASSDLSVLRWGYRRLRAAMNSDAVAPVRVREVTSDADDDAATDAAMRSSLATIHHVSGTARMSRNGTDGSGVVDGQLRVHGARGLRIVDASVFPRIPTVQIQAAVYAAAERAATMIRSAEG